MKVLKFGGTSVGSVKSLKNVKQIVEACQEPVIVVVSALGGITDKLLETARQAAAGLPDYEDNLREIVARHHDIIAGIVAEERRDEVRRQTDSLLDELGNIYRGVALIRDLSVKTQNIIVSYGERLSSFIISRVIDGAEHYDSRTFIRPKRSSRKTSSISKPPTA